MFEPGRVYRRDQLHLEYGGVRQVQRQGGILTPSGQPFILIVSGKAGERYGYHDFWDADGVFHYYGAGMEGPMVFLRGNVALRDHVEEGKDLHLLEEAEGGLRYRGQMVCAGFHFEDDVPDVNGTPRRAIVFLLVPVADLDARADSLRALPARASGVEGRWTMELAELRGRAGRRIGEQPQARVGKRRTWERSEDLRVYVRRRANGRCEGCGLPAPFVTPEERPYLEPHHVRRLTDGGPDDVHHVIAICPTCHRRVHHGKDGDAYNAELVEKLAAIEPG